LKHDPERNAAAYLAGLLSGARRRMFERHIVECEDCWREVDLGREGRSVAESGRELAPQSLRERVRAAVETMAPSPRRPRWVFGVAAITLVAAAVTAVVLAIPRQPREIEAVLASFERGHRMGSLSEPKLPAHLANLTLDRAEESELAGLEVVAHHYLDPSGDEVVVYVTDRQWPVALGAEHDNAGEMWTAREDELVMICLNDPVPSLVVGDNIHDVQSAAYSLRP
jgi:Putative zinc-finger